MRLIDADALIEKYNESSGTISDLMECVLDAESVDATPVIHAHCIINWLGDCHCSNCGEGIDCTSDYCYRCGAKLDEPEQRE